MKRKLTPESKRAATLDLVGQRFGKLTVLYHTRRDGERRTYAFCQCDCGRTSEPTSDALRSGRTKSCGCFRAKVSRVTRSEAVRLTNENERLTDENEALKTRIQELEALIDGRGIQDRTRDHGRAGDDHRTGRTASGDGGAASTYGTPELRSSGRH